MRRTEAIDRWSGVPASGQCGPGCNDEEYEDGEDETANEASEGIAVGLQFEHGGPGVVREPFRHRVGADERQQASDHRLDEKRPQHQQRASRSLSDDQCDSQAEQGEQRGEQDQACRCGYEPFDVTQVEIEVSTRGDEVRNLEAPDDHDLLHHQGECGDHDGLADHHPGTFRGD